MINHTTAEFVSPRMEEDFRNAGLSQQKNTISYAMALPVSLMLINTVYDAMVLDFENVSMVAFYRVLYLFISVWVFYYLRKVSVPSKLDVVVLGWLLSTAFLLLIVESSRPEAFSNHRFALDFMFVIYIYLLIPTQLLNQIVVAGTFTIPVLFIVTFGDYKLDNASYFAIALVVTLSNGVGWVISRRIHLLMRELYLAKKS